MKRFLLFAFVLIFSLGLSANGDPVSAVDPLEVTFYKNPQQLFDYTYQQYLREQANWQAFMEEHGTWYVYFNEENQKPHRAFGQPIPTFGATPQEQAMNFVENNLEGFDIPVESLVLQGLPASKKSQYVNYSQFHNGIEIINSRFTVKMRNGNVIMWGADVYSDIDIDTNPTITSEGAISAAQADMIEEITGSVAADNLKIIAVPGEKTHTYHLVYEVRISTISSTGVPSRYYTLVDAQTGNIWYRQDEVKHFDACPKCGDTDPKKKKVLPMGMMSISGEVSAELYPVSIIFGTEESVGLPDLEVNISGDTFHTDSEGNFTTTVTGPASASIPLEGKWSKVQTNGSTPSMSMQLQEGSNTLSYDGEANLKELSAYRNVSIVHDRVANAIPGFTGMDFQIETNIDVAGECNAFYDGTINFFDLGGGCNPTSLLADVVYHEYGHGINYEFYADQGSFFQNGAFGEGYADFWAISITDNPNLGQGFYTTDDNGIRRYDIDPKVYPQDLIGQVHNDGEIIMGAWWDSHVLMGGDWDHTMDLFVGTYYGLQATVMSGNEGVGYTDVLVDLLQEDDDDDDITNGTPNGWEIVEGFAIHGITLLSNATFLHQDVKFYDADVEIEINAEVDVVFPFSDFLAEGTMFYSINTENNWTETELVNTDGDNYTAIIPAQEAGTVVSYYIGLYDTFGNLTNVKPIGSNDSPYPNLPYYILVGVDEEWVHDCDNAEDFGFWQTGVPGDLATTGQWELDEPIGSYMDSGGIVQTDADHTLLGEFCFITGQSPNPNAGIGENDVDGGHTTLRSPVLDLTEFDNPIVTYWRWYTNETGANPGSDWWQVMISDDGGDSWEYVENTLSQEIAWRRNAFRVQDYIDITDEFRMQFIASDSTTIGENLDGGSLIEAAVDDMFLYDDMAVGIDEIPLGHSLQLYPNPATDQINLTVSGIPGEAMSYAITDMTGKILLREDKGKLLGHETRIIVPVESLSAGVYLVTMTIGEIERTRKFTVRD